MLRVNLMFAVASCLLSSLASGFLLATPPLALQILASSQHSMPTKIAILGPAPGLPWKHARVASCFRKLVANAEGTSPGASGLSEKALALAKQLKVRPLFSTETFSEACGLGFSESRFLTDAELQHLSNDNNQDQIALCKLLRDQHQDLIQSAREEVYSKHPGITEPGGGLYPPIRADACWRDFEIFLQIVTYGIAEGNKDFTSSEGSRIMGDLYVEMQVPLDAMETGIKGLKKAAEDAAVQKGGDCSSGWAKASTNFDHLVSVLSSFGASKD